MGEESTVRPGGGQGPEKGAAACLNFLTTTSCHLETFLTRAQMGITPGKGLGASTYRSSGSLYSSSWGC